MSFSVPKGETRQGRYFWKCDHLAGKYRDSPSDCPWCKGGNVTAILESLEAAKGQTYFGNLKAFLSLEGFNILSLAIAIRDLNGGKFTPKNFLEIVDLYASLHGLQRLRYRTRVFAEWLEEVDFMPSGTYDSRQGLRPVKENSAPPERLKALAAIKKNVCWKDGGVAINAKRIAETHKKELSFVLKATLERAESLSEIKIAGHKGKTIYGFCHFHHCTRSSKEGQTTIYSLVVLPEFRGFGWGRLLFYKVLCAAIEAGSDRIVLKCPQDLPANNFYKRLGFKKTKTIEPQGKRKLNVWTYKIELPLLFFCGSGSNSKHDAIAADAGWMSGARSDRGLKQHVCFLDLDWKKPDVKNHQQKVEQNKPLLATVLDVETPEQIPLAFEMAENLAPYCGRVVVVPKCFEAFEAFSKNFKHPFWWGYSVPTGYGSSPVSNVLSDSIRLCHLLGGSAKKQASIAKNMARLASLDNNQTQGSQFGKISTARGDRMPFPGEVENGKDFCYRCLKQGLRLQKKYWHEERHLQLKLFPEKME